MSKKTQPLHHTTIGYPEPLYEALRAKSFELRRSLNSLIVEAMRKVWGEESAIPPGGTGRP